MFEIIAMVFVCIGVVLITIPNIKGMYMMTVAQVLWGIFSIQHGHWYFFWQSCFLLVFNIFGIYNWKRKGIG